MDHHPEHARHGGERGEAKRQAQEDAEARQRDGAEDAGSGSPRGDAAPGPPRHRRAGGGGGGEGGAPIWVARVSACAVASEPTSIAQPISGFHGTTTAPTAAQPPFAMTWRALRRGCRSFHAVSRLPDRKNSVSSARPLTPAPQTTSAPTTTAAAAPRVVSQRRFTCPPCRTAAREPAA